MQTVVLPLPLHPHVSHRPFARAATCRRLALHHPTRGAVIEPLPRELVEQEAPLWPKQAGDLSNGRIEIRDVVQRQARYDDVETSWTLELLQTRAAEERTVRRFRVDCDHVMPPGGEGCGEIAASAADLEDAAAWTSKRTGDKGHDVRGFRPYVQAPNLVGCAIGGGRGRRWPLTGPEPPCFATSSAGANALAEQGGSRAHELVTV